MSKKTKPKLASSQTIPAESSPSSTGGKKRAPVDPEILKLRKKHRAEMNEFIQSKTSGVRLTRLIKQEIPRLTVKDQEKLRDHMDQITTAKLPLTDPEPTMTEPRRAQPVEEVPPVQEEDSPWPAEMAEI